MIVFEPEAERQIMHLVKRPHFQTKLVEPLSLRTRDVLKLIAKSSTARNTMGTLALFFNNKHGYEVLRLRPLEHCWGQKAALRLRRGC